MIERSNKMIERSNIMIGRSYQKSIHLKMLIKGQLKASLKLLKRPITGWIEWLKDRIKWLVDRIKWLVDRIKWLVDRIKWLVDRIKWLEDWIKRLEDLTWRDGLLQNLEQLSGRLRVHLVGRKNSRKGRKKVEIRTKNESFSIETRVLVVIVSTMRKMVSFILVLQTWSQMEKDG